MNTPERHDWHKDARGRRCSKCGVVSYGFYGETRFEYPDGRLHGARSVDEPSCEGGRGA